MAAIEVKICGLTCVTDACSAADAGADWLGLNLFPGSPRYVALPVARQIIDATPSCRHAAILVRPSTAELWETLRHPFASLQLHLAEELVSECWPILRECGTPVILAAGVGDIGDWSRLLDLKERAEQELGRPIFRLLADAKVAGQHGGTGQPAPWALLARLRQAEPLWLAGGLKPANVALAIRQVRPTGVDVASGVESAPGKKDHDLMRSFVAEARLAAGRATV